MHFHWSCFDIPSVGHRISSRNFFGVLDHLVKSWCNISFSSLEEAGICLVWGLLIHDDGMDFSDCEIDSFSEFILIINMDPFFNKSSWVLLNILWDFKSSKLFRFHNGIIFGCFWWLTELRSVRCLLCHLSKDFVSFLWIEVFDWKAINILISFRIVLGQTILFESLLTSNVHNGLNNSQSL